MDSQITPDLTTDGFTIIRDVMSPSACHEMSAQIGHVMQSNDGNAINAGKGRVVGGRNLLRVWDGWRAIVDEPSIRSLVASQLGKSAGVVRILYFDKPPGKGWSLSLHKDRTIAVKVHVDPIAPFSKPTFKAGVAHVEATETLLAEMLTLRLHLDPMHDDNGPLVVVPGSHAGDSDRDIEVIHCGVGDVFVMRPLLSHGSRASNPTTADHRRVVHLEFAPHLDLPGRHEWHQFESIS